MALEQFCGRSRSQRRMNGEREDIHEEVERSMIIDGSQFAVPRLQHPTAFVKNHFGNGSKMEFKRGTTTLAFSYAPKTPKDKGGILVAVDSRASSGTYTSSQTVMKILEVSDSIVATMAGGAADCQYWIRYLAKETALYELNNKEKMTVAAASKHLSNVLYYFRHYGLSVGSMVAGYDKRGPSIYFVDNEGVRLAGKCFSVGSGCLNAISVLDAHLEDKMTDDEAIQLGMRAIACATFRDAGSGGYVSVCHISPEGKNFMKRKADVSTLYESFMAERGVKPYAPKVQ